MDCNKVCIFLFVAFFTETCTGTSIGYIYPQYRIEDDCERNESLVYTLDPRGPKSGAMILASSATRTAKDRECTILVRAPSNNKGYGIVLTVRKFDFHSTKSKCPASLEIFLDGNQTRTVCTVPEEGESFASSRALKIIYHTTADARLQYQTDFLLIVNAYKLKMSYTWCGYGKFRCANGRCIWSGLICDGYDNCGDNSDEDDMGLSECFRNRLYRCNVLKQKHHKSCDELELEQSTTDPVPIVNVDLKSNDEIKELKSINELPDFDLMAVVMNHTKRKDSTSEVQSVLTENIDFTSYNDLASTYAQTLEQQENISLLNEMNFKNFNEETTNTTGKNVSSEKQEEALLVTYLQQYLNAKLGKEEFLIKLKTVVFQLNASDSDKQSIEPITKRTGDEKTEFKLNEKTYPWIIFLFVVLYYLTYRCVKRVYAQPKST